MSATPGEVQVPVQQRVSPAAGQPAGRLRRPDRSQQRPVAELRAVALAGARRFAAAPADEVLDWAVEEFGMKLAVACSMAEAVLPHLVSARLPGVEVVFLDTGYHFDETLATRDEVVRRLPVTVVNLEPRRTVAEQDAEFGEALHSWDPVQCCEMRKVLPLRAGLAGYEAWASGLRREDSPARAATPIVEWDRRNAMVKINPIAAWTSADLDAYVAAHQVPVNPLLAQGYPSIGCAPCTARVGAGDDARAGRWKGFDKNECGIHI
jgi:phosphoadenosine phosphosulfate reductase